MWLCAPRPEESWRSKGRRSASPTVIGPGRRTGRLDREPPRTGTFGAVEDLEAHRRRRKTTRWLLLDRLGSGEDLANLGGDFKVFSGVNEKGPHRSVCRRQIPVASDGLIAVSVESHP